MDFFVWPLKWKPLTSTLHCMKKNWNSGIIGRPRVKKWPKMCKVGHNLWILMLSRWWLCWGEKGPFKAFKNMGHVWMLVDAQKISSKISMISHFFVILTTFDQIWGQFRIQHGRFTLTREHRPYQKWDGAIFCVSILTSFFREKIALVDFFLRCVP